MQLFILWLLRSIFVHSMFTLIQVCIFWRFILGLISSRIAIKIWMWQSEIACASGFSLSLSLHSGKFDDNLKSFIINFRWFLSNVIIFFRQISKHGKRNPRLNMNIMLCHEISYHVCVLAYQKKNELCVFKVCSPEKDQISIGWRLECHSGSDVYHTSHNHFIQKQMKHYNMPWWTVHKLCYNKQNCRAMIFF